MNPPGWFVGLGWTIVYVSSGTASFLVWLQHANHNVDITFASLFYIVCLICNGLFYPLFFGVNHSIILALIDSILLFISVTTTAVLFYRISRPASFIMMFYALYNAFALYLTFHIVIANNGGYNLDTEEGDTTAGEVGVTNCTLV